MSADVLSLAVVAIGDFAPGMFHPSWFEKLQLLGKHEVERAAESEQLLVSSAQTIFSISGFEIQVHENRFQILTNREDLHQPLIDLFTSVLSVLDSCPIRAVGINWTIHLRAENEKAWHAFGDKMAPKEFWKKNWEHHVGLRHLLIQLDKQNEDDGSVNVNIEPSYEVKPGIFVRVNDHNDFKNKDAVAASKFVSENWRGSKETAENFIKSLRLELTNG